MSICSPFPQRPQPGTPTTYAGALQHSSQVRVLTEPTWPFRVVHVNRAWEQLCGWRAAEVQGERSSRWRWRGRTRPCKVVSGVQEDHW